ncbi:MAG: ATP-binding protein [Polyangiaceae bacterium]|nr:ATP-binding protein [Polyangiaceae bacterium]
MSSLKGAAPRPRRLLPPQPSRRSGRWRPRSDRARSNSLQHVVDVEEKDRARRRASSRRRTRNRLERFKPMADFDWNWPTKIDDRSSESIVRLDFLRVCSHTSCSSRRRARSKTMIAQNIAHQAILAGHGVLFLATTRLLLDLATGPGVRRAPSIAVFATTRKDPACSSSARSAFLAFDNRNADLLFQVVSRRYGRRSLVLTTNRVHWPTIFPNATCATALIDRVVHHSDVIPIGASWRLARPSSPPGPPSQEEKSEVHTET